MTLPTDVVDLILSFLQSDPAALKACAQSHPNLSNLSERYIYANIILYEGHRVSTLGSLEGLKTSKFSRLLAKSPEIANHVRILKVYLNDDADIEQSQAMAFHLNNLAWILPLLSGLTRITLAGTPDNWYHFSWRTLPEAFCQAVLHVLHIQGMKAVTLSRVAYFPMSLLNNCKDIRITLDKCEEMQYDEEPIEDVSFPAFEHLSIRNCSATSLKNTMAWIRNHKLRTLNAAGDVGKFWKSFPRLLAACSSSLTHLELDIADHFQTFSSVSNNSEIEYSHTYLFPFTLAGLSHLEWLTIYARPSTTGPEYDHLSPVPGITELISTAPPSLRRLSLDLYLFWDPGTVFWSFFVPLAARCSSLSITVSVSLLIRQGPHNVSSALAHCAGLKPYLEKGIFVVIPRVE